MPEYVELTIRCRDNDPNELWKNIRCKKMKQSEYLFLINRNQNHKEMRKKNITSVQLIPSRPQKELLRRKLGYLSVHEIRFCITNVRVGNC
ncbi:hypothetical protein RCL_jg14021.t1 [Rhizophagus clarus]|uniref:Uncharacterized protein n=1 Tax=Rhizophagus clarus TaxID=94130 RepID=A0A8H3LSQ5_9GLOM|nr:hypothetical protein RCL_jg14021.t1 [Rhizophagus clarus]